VQLAKQLRPDVMVMDVAMPLMNGLEATRQITRSVPQTKILVLSSYDEEDYVQQLLEAGAKGYLLKQTAANDLRQAVRDILQGKAYFSPSISRRLAAKSRDNYTRTGKANPQTPRLTSREAEVLQLIAEGLANKQIAAELAISIKTVEKHRQQVMNKLGIHEVAGLTRHAISRGMVESPNRLRAGLT
jgi:DNA-binding NarL/FixJ family response regulator